LPKSDRSGEEREDWHMRRVRLAVVLGLLSSAVLAQVAENARLAWQREPDSVLLLKGEQVLWRFRYGKDDAKPAFHPVALPGGPVLTCFRAEDHPWHRGLWFSWKFVNGVNYWEENKAGVPEGLTEVKSVKVETVAGFIARIALDIAYRPGNGQPVLTEQRLIEVSPPDPRNVSSFDWTMTFKALDKDVLLDRTPIPGEPDGKSYGGYAGLAVRLAREMTGIQVVTSQGPVSFPESGYRGIRPRAAAADFSGVLENREVGFTFLDHPGNLNAPSPWWIIDQKAMKYFNPSVLGSAPHTLKAGQSMTLRYRALVHFERWNADRLQAELKRYAKAQR
jgi:Methane oxygenase PmoA